VADFLDESVEAQPFQDAADMPAFFPEEHPLEQPVA
jgi:hypothetical protein